MKHHDIVTIGNGTGQGVILQALRKLTDLDRVSAIVSITDNGGHSGALRADMHVPSMGDVKTVIAALSGETVWGQIFRHRFQGGRLNGVSMGNLLLATLMDQGGTVHHASRRLCQAMGIDANILPVSETNAQVVAELADGSEVIGEWETITREKRDVPIVGVHHEPEVHTSQFAIKALEDANWIILCPGTLWIGIGSILAAPGLVDVISKSDATLIAVGNVLTQPGVTDGMSARDHLDVLEKMVGRNIDFYLVHDGGLPDEVLRHYKDKGFTQVIDDLGENGTQIVRGDLVSHSFIHTVDRVHYDSKRGYPHAMRHDPSMLARIFLHVSQVTPASEGFADKPKLERWEVRDF